MSWEMRSGSAALVGAEGCEYAQLLFPHGETKPKISGAVYASRDEPDSSPYATITGELVQNAAPTVCTPRPNTVEPYSAFKPLEVVIGSDDEDDDFVTVEWRSNCQLKRFSHGKSTIRKPTISAVGKACSPSPPPHADQTEVINGEVQSSSNSSRLNSAAQNVAHLQRQKEQMEFQLAHQMKKSVLLRSRKEIKDIKSRLNWVNVKLNVALKELARCPVGDGTSVNVAAVLEQNQHGNEGQHKLETTSTDMGKILKFVRSFSRSTSE
ncbi:MAG: hypothetical protein KVP17_002402 [Porospora cf. gigantea B]|uniref:uncharacterized protein n=1 Tax=Porospora cf. gigantea B TaxID=2853592 RepID=UPI003571ADF3|nr:MAG: hypothetical protein KVP17_002402 [Porospora cf. gigantea B]